jgi:hypothetical protein
MRFIMTLVPLLVLASAARAQRPDRFVGLWQGELNGQSVRLRLGLIVQADGPSALRGTLISIDQNNATFPATLVRRGDSLDVAVANLNIKYVAALTNAADGMVGMFEQGALKQSLTMVRVPKIEVAASPAVAVPMTYPTHLASDSAIRALLVKRIDEQRRTPRSTGTATRSPAPARCGPRRTTCSTFWRPISASRRLSNSAAAEGVIDLGAYILTGGGSLYEPPPSKPNVP